MIIVTLKSLCFWESKLGQTPNLAWGQLDTLPGEVSSTLRATGQAREAPPGEQVLEESTGHRG